MEKKKKMDHEFYLMATWKAREVKRETKHDKFDQLHRSLDDRDGEKYIIQLAKVRD